MQHLCKVIVVILWVFLSSSMIFYLPVGFPFKTHAGRFVDPAFEIVCCYNFYIMVSFYIPFEITSVNSMIHFWRYGSEYSPPAAFIPQIVICLFLHIYAVNLYGRAKFFLAIGKLVLALGLLFFTFVTMIGGNPHH